MINPMNLDGRLFLVTGASSGIGREIAIVLSRLGARVVLTGRSLEQLNRTQGMLEGQDHVVAPFDLLATDDISRWMRDMAVEHGVLDGMAHSAGIQVSLPLRAMTSAKFEELLRTNLTTAFCLVKGFRQKGVCASTGSVVLLSSVMGLVGEAGQAAYSASKGALVSMAKCLALEMARDGIRVNCVAPGSVRTEMYERMMSLLSEEQRQKVAAMHPLGIGTPSDVAYAVAFLLGDASRWITGTTLVVDGGYTAH